MIPPFDLQNKVYLGTQLATYVAGESLLAISLNNIDQILEDTFTTLEKYYKDRKSVV